MANLSLEPSYPFVVLLEADGRLQFVQGPEDEQVIQHILQGIVQTQAFGPAWDADYRSIYLLSGQGEAQVSLLEDVQAIPVPHWRRLGGTLQGNQFTLTGRETSTDGDTWQPFPTYEDLRQEARHPAFTLPGKTVGQFLTLHWREGRIDIEPDPPTELLELLENVVQAFNGQEESWLAQHAALGGDAGVRPDAKRVTFEVRELAPLFSPSMSPVARQFGLEFWPLIPLEYSPDGKKWLEYPVGGEMAGPSVAAAAGTDDQAAALAALLRGQPADSDQENEDDDGEDPFGMLSSLFDLQTASVTAYADGRVDWEDGEIPAEHGEALRQSIVQATGAGNAEQWQARTAELLPEGQTGTPVALQLQVMKGLLDAAPGMLDQAYAPTALTLDGATWLPLTPPFILDDEDE